MRLFIVTGAAGHVGSTLIRRLSGENCVVRGLILPDETGISYPTVTYYRGDVTNPETLQPLFQGIEAYDTYVIHAAGLVSIADDLSEALLRVNVGGTQNIVALCTQHHVRLVYVSSVHAIPEGDGLSLTHEVSSFSPDTVVGGYAKSKAIASQIVMDAIANGLDAVLVHPSGILGPYNSGNNHLVQLIQMYLDGRLPAGIHGGYDFVDVRDVAMGCISAALYGKKGACYILSNRYITIPKLLNYLASITHGKTKLCLPVWVAKAVIPFFNLQAKLRNKRPLFTRYALYTLATKSRFSHDKATAELRYFPRDIKTTLEDTIFWLTSGKDTAR